jgi:phosphate transport system protein
MTTPLEEIDRKVLQIYALVGESVAGATLALLAGDREAAKALALRDELIDSICAEIDDLALQLLTVGGITSPSQLRYLTTIIRMLPDLERNGDLAEHVARRAARGLGAELSARSRGLIERMGEVAVNMWRATTDAYAERQVSAADIVEGLDDEIGRGDGDAASTLPLARPRPPQRWCLAGQGWAHTHAGCRRERR